MIHHFDRIRFEIILTPDGSSIPLLGPVTGHIITSTQVIVLFSMIRTFVLSILVTGAMTAFGQFAHNVAEITWALPEARSESGSFTKIIGQDETGIYVLKVYSDNDFGQYIPGGDGYLAHYDHDMKRTLLKDLVVPGHDGKKLNLEGIQMFRDEIFLFSSYEDRNRRSKIFYMQQIDKESLTVKAHVRKMAEIDYDIDGGKGKGDFGFKQSPDSTTLMVFYFLPDVKGEQQKLGFHVFNELLEEQWHKEVTIPHREDLFISRRMDVDRNGNVYVMGRVEVDKKQRVKDAPNHNYVLYIINKDTAEPMEYIFDAGIKHLSEMKFVIHDDLDVSCLGWFSRFDDNWAGGFYYARIDGETKEMEVEMAEDFGLDFQLMGYNEREQERLKKRSAKGEDIEFYRIILDHMEPNKEGGVTVVGESRFIRTISSTDERGRTTYEYKFHVEEIIALDLDRDGMLNWKTKIDKKQVSDRSVSPHFSFGYFESGDRKYLMYVDHLKNLDREQGDNPVTYSGRKKNGVVLLVSIDPEGNQVTYPLFVVKDQGCTPIPPKLRQLGDADTYFVGKMKGDRRIAKLEIN